jgi:hypothetical protein
MLTPKVGQNTPRNFSTRLLILSHKIICCYKGKDKECRSNNKEDREKKCHTKNQLLIHPFIIGIKQYIFIPKVSEGKRFQRIIFRNRWSMIYALKCTIHDKSPCWHIFKRFLEECMLVRISTFFSGLDMALAPPPFLPISSQ